MATVGNLFVNVRGRTSGFVRDMKRAHKSVKKDFYRNEALAREQYVRAVGKVQSVRGQSEAIRTRMLDKSDAARRQMLIASSRPERLARRRGLMATKSGVEAGRAFLAREAKALIPLVFGVPAAALAFVISQGTKAFKSASQFAAIGPAGGRFIEAEVGKVMDELAFAQRGDVSSVMAKTAELERANAVIWREVGLELRMVLNAVMERLGLSMEDFTSPPITGDPGFRAGDIDERGRANLKRRQSQIAAKERLRSKGMMTTEDILNGIR